MCVLLQIQQPLILCLFLVLDCLFTRLLTGAVPLQPLRTCKSERYKLFSLGYGLINKTISDFK